MRVRISLSLSLEINVISLQLLYLKNMTSNNGALNSNSNSTLIINFRTKSISITYYMCSAKTGDGITEAFLDLSNRMISIIESSRCGA